LAKDIEGTAPPGVIDELRGAAESAEALIRNGPVVSSAPELFRAELLIQADGTRPAAIIREGSLFKPNALGDFGELYTLSKATADVSLKAAGRIDAGGAQLGGGMIIAIDGADEPLVLTAGHVVALWLDASGTRLRPGCSIDFNAEIGASQSNRYEMTSIVAWGWNATAGVPDYALVRLGRTIDDDELPAPAVTDQASWKLGAGETIAVVGFPAKPALPASAVGLGTIWHQLFGGAWNVKRISPGRVSNAPADNDSVELVWYDATTTGGSSGSGILTFGSGYLAGIHAGGLVEANRGMSLEAIAAASGRRFS
jgi:hypothetical protein